MGSIGSAFTGMAIGQMLIPVPFVGSFVGGVIGGYLGERGSREINSILDKRKFTKLIDYLRSHMTKNTYWTFTNEIIYKLGINA